MGPLSGILSSMIGRLIRDHLQAAAHYPRNVWQTVQCSSYRTMGIPFHALLR
jgi:hypothetical protein